MMLRRVINRQLIRTKSDRSHLAGVTPKLHEDRSSSLDLAGKLVVRFFLVLMIFSTNSKLSTIQPLGHLKLQLAVSRMALM